MRSFTALSFVLGVLELLESIGSSTKKRSIFFIVINVFGFIADPVSSYVDSKFFSHLDGDDLARLVLAVSPSSGNDVAGSDGIFEASDSGGERLSAVDNLNFHGVGVVVGSEFTILSLQIINSSRDMDFSVSFGYFLFTPEVLMDLLSHNNGTSKSIFLGLLLEVFVKRGVVIDAALKNYSVFDSQGKLSRNRERGGLGGGFDNSFGGDDGLNGNNNLFRLFFFFFKCGHEA